MTMATTTTPSGENNDNVIVIETQLVRYKAHDADSFDNRR